MGPFARWVLPGLLVVGSTTVLPAQVHPGQMAPGLEVQWPEGAQLALRGDRAAAATVIVFHRSVALATIDLDLLRDLMARYGTRGVRCVVVLPQSPANEAGELTGIPVAVDHDGAARSRWLADQLDFYVVVVRAERVAWIGRPGQGLCATVRAAIEGKLDPVASGDLWRRRMQLVGTFSSAGGAEALALAQRLVEQWPTDGPSWALCYLADAQKLGNKAGAGLTAGAAIEALAAEPRALAAFADLALRGDGRNRALGRQLAEALTAAASAYPDDLRVQLARLRALVLAGDGREVGRFAHQIAKKVERVGSAALEYVEILTHDEQPIVHKDLSARLLRAAVAAGAEPRSLAAVRYAAALLCDGDPMAARDIASDYMEQAGGRTVLNNDAWDMLTDLATMGRFDPMALALVQRMLDQRAAMAPFEFDTAALAMFRNGRVDEAVELQATAIDLGGDEPEYQVRLDRYRGAAAAGKAMPR